MKKNKIKNYIDIIFIILREENLGHKDIDHILPFLYFLSKTKALNYKARGIILENEMNYLNSTDPRVNLLANLKNVEIKYLYKNKFIYMLKSLKELKGISIFSNVFRLILNKIYLKQLKIKKNNINIKNKVGETFIRSKSPIIITLHVNDEAQRIVKKIKKLNKKAKWLVVPEGTTLCDNKMVTNDQLNKDEKNSFKLNKKKYKKVDYFLLTSKRDEKDLIIEGLDNKKSFVIGSPRYTNDWIKVKTNLKLDGNNVTDNEKYKINLLFLTPKKFINIFHEEFLRTIDFISSYNEIELILLNYTPNYPKLPNYLINRSNIRTYLISKDYSTSKIIDWADIVFHVGSGVIFEAFIKEKITVLPRYLSCNTLISDIYGAGFNLKNRDELRILCNRAVNSFYDLKKIYKKKCSVSNKKFINDFVNANSISVKKNIEKTLLNIANSF